MSEPIEVRIAKRTLDGLVNEALKGTHILSMLRAAGVPVLGALFPHGVSHGVLTCTFDDLAIEEYVWTWQP